MLDPAAPLICAACGEPGPDAPACPTCGADPRLAGRYRLEAVVGRGGSGVTYRATRLLDGRRVAVKERVARHARAEDARLVQREVAVLRQLDHPAIPRYLEHFDAGVGRHRHTYLVSEFVEGQTLQAEMQTRRYREDEALAIAAEVLEVLVYLHDLRPPVVHRDVKPGNLMRRADGRLVLIDFGSVRDAIEDPRLGGRTIAGTFGYMAPEQYRGDASPASDLYALGVTLLVLLTRREPDELFEAAAPEAWRAKVHGHPATLALLEALLAPDPAARLGDARQALRRVQATIDALRAPAPEAPATAPPPAPPRRKRGFRLVRLLGPLAFGSLFATPLCGWSFGACSGYNEPVMAALGECALARDLLGENIRLATFGCATGETVGGCDAGEAEWSYPVQGDTARGRLNFVANSRGGRWRLTAGVLTVGDRRVEVRHCTPLVDPP